MASIKDLKKRIGSVKNTQQTTRAMKVVSAAKLRRAQEAIQSQRPYARKITDLLKLALSVQTEKLNSPLICALEEGLSEGAQRQNPKLLLILVTSDRGLCGGFNGNVIKGAQRWIAANKAKYSEIQLGFVGRKGYEFFKNRVATPGPYYAEVGGKVTASKAKQLSHALVEHFLSGECGEVKFIYNEFKNAVTQVVQVEDFLPLVEPAAPMASEATELPNYIVKPDAKTLVEELVQVSFSAQVFRILLDSQASEHGARMSAMENATKNAGEMIRKLTLQYNKQRQAGITKELLEIISGSESQKQ